MKPVITTIPLSGALEHKDEPVSLLQIWVLPERKDVEPRYDQISYDNSKLLNNLYQVISPDKSDSGSRIYQQSWFSLGDLEKDKTVRYPLKKTGNGIYLFIMEGKVETGGIVLEKRDALGISESEEIEIQSKDKSRVLLMEVPMT